MWQRVSEKNVATVIYRRYDIAFPIDLYLYITFADIRIFFSPNCYLEIIANTDNIFCPYNVHKEFYVYYNSYCLNIK